MVEPVRRHFQHKCLREVGYIFAKSFLSQFEQLGCSGSNSPVVLYRRGRRLIPRELTPRVCINAPTPTGGWPGSSPEGGGPPPRWGGDSSAGTLSFIPCLPILPPL